MGGSKVDVEVFRKNEMRFIKVLENLTQVLQGTGKTSQADFVSSLIELIKSNELEVFYKSINGVGMWGGAGAVWEVYIEEKSVAREFEKEMLILIELMEQTGIKGRGIDPIKRLFENNLKS